MAEINWGLAVNRTNPFASFSEGMQTGQAMRKDRQEAEQEAARKKAYNLFTTNPVAAEQALMAAGDLQGANAMRDRRQDEGTRFKRGMIGMIAQKDPKAAQAKALQVGEYDLAENIGKLDDQQRKAAGERAGVLVAYIDSLQGKSEQEIMAEIQKDAPALMELGYTREQLAAFRPTPGVLAKLRAEALGLKGMLEEQNRQRDDERATERDGEMRQYREDMLDLAGRRVGVSERREGRVAAGAGKAAGKPAMPGPRPTGRKF